MTMDDARKLVPADYLPALQKVERKGWNGTKWDRGYTLLHWAARYGNLDLCKFFIASCAADPLAEDDRGLKPVDHAMRKEHREVVEFLRELEVKDADSPQQKESIKRSLRVSLVEQQVKMSEHNHEDDKIGVSVRGSTGNIEEVVPSGSPEEMEEASGEEVEDSEEAED